MFKQATGTMIQLVYVGSRGWINSDLIAFTYNIKQKPTQCRMIFLMMYYILAGQTSVLQVLAMRILPWDVFLCSIFDHTCITENK